MTDTLSTIRQYLEAGTGEPCCRALLEDAVAEIEALRRQQEHLKQAWRDNARYLRQQATQAGVWGHVGEQIRLEERAKGFEDRVKELGGVG